MQFKVLKNKLNIHLRHFWGGTYFSNKVLLVNCRTPTWFTDVEVHSRAVKNHFNHVGSMFCCTLSVCIPAKAKLIPRHGQANQARTPHWPPSDSLWKEHCSIFVTITGISAPNQTPSFKEKKKTKHIFKEAVIVMCSTLN